jgi:hypothetical protein
MFKITPNPPPTDPIPHDPALDPQKVKEATDRALDYYLRPKALGAPPSSPPFRPVYLVDPTLDEETLLALQQVIMLNELLVNRLLDKLRVPQ